MDELLRRMYYVTYVDYFILCFAGEYAKKPWEFIVK